MREKKTLHERETELRALLITPKGRSELENLAARYGQARERETELEARTRLLLRSSYGFAG
jgi:hypothetical protein